MCVCENVCVSVISDQFHQFKDICVIKRMSSCFIQAVHKTNKANIKYFTTHIPTRNICPFIYFLIIPVLLPDAYMLVQVCILLCIHKSI